MNPQVFGGQSSLQGQTVGSIYVQNVVSANPLRYQTKCQLCQTETVISHVALWKGCRNPACNLLRENAELQIRRQAVTMTPDHDNFDPMRLTVPGKLY